MDAARTVHPLAPIYDSESRVLLLGTMPSPKSREVGFYYGHPQNRMWPVLSALFAEPVPRGPVERAAFLHHHHIAMWDVLRACTIHGAADGSISDPEANDLSPILDAAPIGAIFTSGKKAFSLYNRLCKPVLHREAICLPSTSPANCRRETLETLAAAYSALLPYCTG